MGSKVNIIIQYIVAGLYFFIAVFLLANPKFNYIQKNIKFIFAFFFIAYGFYRIARIISKNRGNDDKF